MSKTRNEVSDELLKYQDLVSGVHMVRRAVENLGSRASLVGFFFYPGSRTELFGLCSCPKSGRSSACLAAA